MREGRMDDIVPSQLEQRRAYWREIQRRRRAAQPPLMPPPMRSRALTLLTTFILTPRELSSALDISISHASTLLKRLWQQGRCERWPYRDRSYRYQLRER